MEDNSKHYYTPVQWVYSIPDKPMKTTTRRSCSEIGVNLVRKKFILFPVRGDLECTFRCSLKRLKD